MHSNILLVLSFLTAMLFPIAMGRVVPHCGNDVSAGLNGSDASAGTNGAAQDATFPLFGNQVSDRTWPNQAGNVGGNAEEANRPVKDATFPLFGHQVYDLTMAESGWQRWRQCSGGQCPPRGLNLFMNTPTPDAHILSLALPV